MGRDIFSSCRWHTYTSRMLKLILPYNPLQERIPKDADTHQQQSLLPLWLSLSLQLPLQALLPRQDSFLLPSLLQLCGFLYSQNKKQYPMQWYHIIIILPLPERMSEQFKMENNTRMKLDVLENVAPSPLILILSRQPGAKFCGWTLFCVRKNSVLQFFYVLYAQFFFL